jgi:outer membrane protein OmpA-like peptidoglycan-associated protein/tetratricopeptide (TPR) repeat protein
MKTIRFISTIAGLLIAGVAPAQKMAIDQAELYLHTREYKKAIPILEKLSTFQHSEVWQYHLGYCYVKINDITRADSIFNQIKTTPCSEYYYQAGEVKQRLGNYQTAIEFFTNFKTTQTNDALVDLKIKSCQYALDHSALTNWNVQPNTSFLKGIYTGGCYYNNALWLGFNQADADQQNLPDHNLYASNANTYFTEYTPNDELLQSKYHIGGISFGANGEVIYSVQDSEVSETNDKKLTHHQISQTYLNTLNLLMGVLNGNQIIDVVPFAFNSKEYSCMHPAISQSGHTCYFSSDMPGGFGGFDLYKIEKQNNTWSAPVNLGEFINTAGDEMYPYEYHDSVLYFSSNGLPGYGGADIFKTAVFNKSAQPSVNVGMPANSSGDDFGINFTSAHAGYFFSNRSSLPGTDGLFTFDFPVQVNYDTTNGIILDALTQEPLADVKIIIQGKDTTFTLLSSDNFGGFNFNQMVPNEVYTITAQKEKYYDKKVDITSVQQGTINVELELDPVIALHTIFTLNNILFEYNDYRLTQNSMYVLDKVADVMIRNPKVSFELGAHTDSRGQSADNMVLSQRRAESAVYYLLSKGVKPSQLVPIGYGENHLKNGCNGHAECSELEHAINRRVEIKVISISK